MPKSGGRDEKSGDGRLSRHSSGRYSGKYSSGEPDPGVISEDDDEFRVINLCFFPEPGWAYKRFFGTSLMSCHTKALGVH